MSFRDNAAEAMEFYQSVFGGDLTMSKFGDYPMGMDPAENEKVMHAQLVAPGGMILMGADTPASMEHSAAGGNVSCSLSGTDVDELRGYWTGLTAGGTETVPFEKAPWGDWFGMCVDRFGVSWLVNGGGTPEA
nr:VOC family protein [Nakamurella flavida]